MEFTTAEILALGWAGLLGVFIGLGYLIRIKPSTKRAAME